MHAYILQATDNPSKQTQLLAPGVQELEVGGREGRSNLCARRNAAAKA